MTNEHGWEVDYKTKNVTPMNDLKEHVHSMRCWCKPKRDDEDERIIIHNSADGREAFETGKRKLS